MRRLLLVEGLPGAGKTTLAERLCAFAGSEGLSSRWYLEEAANHPVHPRSLGALKTHADYAAHCLQAWRHFVEQAGADDTLHILEGSALQSTVRFLMEQGHADIDDYFKRFEDIVRALHPAFVYLRPKDAVSHSRATSTHRGSEWTRKVAAYVEQTPYALRRGLRGENGMHEFWADYARLCDALVDGLCMPVTRIDAQPGHEDRAFTAAVDAIQPKPPAIK